MVKYTKISKRILSVALILVLIIPNGTILATTEQNNEQQESKQILEEGGTFFLYSETDEEVKVYLNESNESEKNDYELLPLLTEVVVAEQDLLEIANDDNPLIKIEFSENDEKRIVFVHSQNLLSEEEKDLIETPSDTPLVSEDEISEPEDIETPSEEVQVQPSENIEENDTNNTETEIPSNDELDESLVSEEIIENEPEVTIDNNEQNASPSIDNSESVNDEKLQKQDEPDSEEEIDEEKEATKIQTFQATVANVQTYHGIAKQTSTKIYSSTSTNSSVLKSYEIGSILHYESYNSSWYKAQVYVNGKFQTGYIYAKDVENVTDQQTNVRGIGLSTPTHVYVKASTQSNVLKSYSAGSILNFKTFSTDWYEAEVYVNGKTRTGYIYKYDIEQVSSKQNDVTGIALDKSTNIYQRASRTSSTIKSYSAGSILRFKNFSSNWYIATVYKNGKSYTGYIHKSDIEETTAAKNLKGIALNSPTYIYDKASTSSSRIKNYSKGSILSYTSLSKNWYKAKVYVNGKFRDGYIHRTHVENTIDKKEYKGIALQAPTRIYQQASTNSRVLRSYTSGTVLNYHSFTSNWYEATIYSDGKWINGYIPKSSLENTLSNAGQLKTGYALNKPTKIYELASRTSKVVREYSKGSKLNFKTFSTNWYEAEIYVGGNKKTVYIHKNDITFTPIRQVNIENYNYNFSSFIDTQMRSNPKADGSGRVPASRKLVEYYANPANFPDGTKGFYQFLVLSSSASLDEKEVNDKLLKNVGTLTNTAAAFIEAGRKYNINEAYLIAHALHETGNGTSELAKGVKVNGKTVYNMYGVSAYDGTAVSSGAQHAYDQGWFTPEAAIIGGAQFISNGYIQRGQDTLYKMRWNPDAPGTHQYATHVAWAAIPTSRIADVYETLDNTIQEFEVPKFNNQPGYAGPNPPANELEFIEFPSNTKGVTTGTGVNFRTGPSTANSIIAKIENIGTELTLLGSNQAGWYKAIYNGREGWISADYVKLNNLLQITATGLNVRSGPSTAYKNVGQLSLGDLVLGVLDSNKELVKDNGWYKIYYNGGTHWISSGSNHSYIKIY